MHYKSKRSPGRLLLLALVCVSLVVMMWQKERAKQPDVQGVPVIKPTPHLMPPTPSASKSIPKNRTVDITIRSGDTLAKRLMKLGVSSQVVHELQQLTVANPYLTKIIPGQVFTLTFNDKDELIRLEQNINDLKILSVQRKGEKFQASIDEKPVMTYIKFASATIDDSLFTAGIKQKLDDNIIMQLANIFAWDIDFSLDIRPGDQFSILYEERYVDNKKISAGNIVAAQFVNQGRIHQAIRFEDSLGNTDYFAPDGTSLRKAFLRSPVNFTRISSRFSLGRKHPVLHTIRAHRGVDYAAPTGTPIKAAGDGKIIFRGVKGGYGNAVIIQHGQQYTTLYAHMSRFASNMKVGQKVKQGQVIGYVGMTGLASGPHLHYEFRINDVHQNPLTVKLPESSPIGDEFKDIFTANAKTLLNQLSYHQQMEVATAL